MATPKKFPTDKPGASSPRKPTSSVQPYAPVSIPQVAFQNLAICQHLKVAFLGRAGSGRNSLAWRMDNLNNSEFPVLPSLPLREMVLQTGNRPAVGHVGTVGLQIRIVPPENYNGQLFFEKHGGPPFSTTSGGINECDFIVFVVDIGDESSCNEFYTLFKKAKKARREMPPYLIVGNKVDLRLFGMATPHKWGENTASSYKARAYLECSAKSNDRVGDVLDLILRILLFESEA